MWGWAEVDTGEAGGEERLEESGPARWASAATLADGGLSRRTCGLSSDGSAGVG